MPLPIPVLDDLEWSDLLAEGRESIPAAAPRWTDHNIHDPGITIIELVAWMAEQLGYRLDQIPDRHRLRFLDLVGLSQLPDESISEVMARAGRILAAHEQLVYLAERSGVTSLDDLDPAIVAATEPPPRAVNLLDFERLALTAPGVDLARARAWANIDLDVPCAVAPGTVSVVVVPSEPADRPEAGQALIATVCAHLRRHRTVGTRVRVFGPGYVPVTVETEITSTSVTDPSRLIDAVRLAITDFLHPLRGGPNGLGWPFGRDVYRSELLAVIGNVDGVDLPVSLTVTATGDVPEDSVGGQGCDNLCIPAAGLVAVESIGVTVLSSSDVGAGETRTGDYR